MLQKLIIQSVIGGVNKQINKHYKKELQRNKREQFYRREYIVYEIIFFYPKHSRDLVRISTTANWIVLILMTNGHYFELITTDMQMS